VLIAIAAAAGVLYLAWSEDWGGIQEATQGVIDFLVTLPETIGGIMTDCADGRRRRSSRPSRMPGRRSPTARPRSGTGSRRS
jgi:hypothetical protein